MPIAVHCEPVFVENIAELGSAITDIVNNGDIVVTLGAGSIGAFASEFLAAHRDDGRGE
jgi:UDP-N-acetylmuramate--alanine ligase